MPFDALVAPARPKPLLEVLADHGVTPVSLELLEAHKRAQLERFAPELLVSPPASAAGRIIGIGRLHGGDRRIELNA